MSIDLSSTYQENHIKVILLGNAGVGKTNLINVAMRRKFESNSASTLSQIFRENL
jgi:GTPase SAR1 family protein